MSDKFFSKVEIRMAENTNTCTNNIFKHSVGSENISLGYCLSYDNATEIKMPHYVFFCIFFILIFARKVLLCLTIKEKVESIVNSCIVNKVICDGTIWVVSSCRDTKFIFTYIMLNCSLFKKNYHRKL